MQGKESTGGNSAEVTSPGPEVTTPTVEELTIRLPTAISPVSYDVRLQPIIGGNFSIYGDVVIEMQVVEATSLVVLHMADIVTDNDTITVSRELRSATGQWDFPTKMANYCVEKLFVY